MRTSRNVWLVIGLSVLGTGCVHVADKETGYYSLRNYREAALELEEVILATEIIPQVQYSSALNERIQGISFTLMEVGQGIGERFIQKNKNCRAVLAAVKNLKSEVGLLTAENLAKRYDLDSATASQNSEKCYAVRDLVLHPATIIVTLKSPIDKNSFEKLRHEIKQATDLTQEISL